MLMFVMFGGLGLVLGAGFRVAAVLTGSALAFVAVFAATMLSGFGVGAALSDAILAAAGLQTGYALTVLARAAAARTWSQPTSFATVREIAEGEDISPEKGHLAIHDTLTGLPNRILLEDRAHQAIAHARRSGLGLAVLSIGFDRKESIDRSYKDVAIQVSAGRIEGLLRDGETVARPLGDNLIVLLCDLADAGADAARVAAAILEALKAPIVASGAAPTASIGIGLFPADGRDFGQLLRNAEAAMRQARSLGGGGCQFHSPEVTARANDRILLEGELRRALRLDQFELAYQPLVDIPSGTPIGVEALVRWNHPELGWLQPGRFIATAEETGLLGQIGRFVLREACRQNRAWQREGLPAMPISVNIAAAQLRHPDFADIVEDILAETGLDPKHLELEITEATMMEMNEALLARVGRLKQLGIRVSIDDFGTGYSNLAYLRTFPRERLKIDRSFIGAAPGDEGAVAIVRAILGLGESLGIAVVAEGVETAGQAQLLEGLGCREAQGFFYAKPMPAAATRDWLLAHVPPGSRRSHGLKSAI